jgi:hypothetical protein
MKNKGSKEAENTRDSLEFDVSIKKGHHASPDVNSKKK